ncbi:MAG: hypothetical protein HYV28_02510 [Ignavibacteriales bacterium]|nr:hypothetical protein [Ignavibacteriales bacterium]
MKSRPVLGRGLDALIRPPQQYNQTPTHPPLEEASMDKAVAGAVPSNGII